MGAAIEVVTGRVTNPGAVLTALTAGTGNSFTVRAFDSPSKAYLEEVWFGSAAAAIGRIRSPRMHDAAQGIRIRHSAGVIRGELGKYPRQVLYPQDTLTVELSGGAAETDMLAMLMHYEDLGGIAQRLATWDQVKPRIRNIAGFEVACTTSATLGDWPAGTLVNATFDNWKANEDYAILGYETDVAVCCVALQGPDTGNLRIGGPGPVEPLATRDYFIRLSNDLGEPAIPIINAANKLNTFVQCADPANAASVNVTLIVAELG